MGRAEDNGLVLYHDWGSTCSQKVRLTLAEKGLAYDSRIVRIRRFEHLTPEFLAINPEALLPVLLHDGFKVTESSVICEYLDAVFAEPPLQPADARGRSAVSTWTRFIDQITSPAIKKPSFAQNLVDYLHTVGVDEVDTATSRMPSLSIRDRWRKAVRSGFSSDELADAHNDLRRTLDRMQHALESAPWLAGETYTLADIGVMPFIERIATFPEYRLEADWPGVARWRARMLARPAFARAQFTDPASAAVVGVAA